MNLLNQIRDRLQTFIEQRDDVALVLRSPVGYATPLLKVLESVEESNASHLFWVFTDNFTDASTYASGIVKAFAGKHELVRLAMEKESMPPWPNIPPAILSDSTPPAQRIRELASFSRELLPIPNGGNNVWIYFPLEVLNPTAFSLFVEEVVRHEFPFRWCHHLRFIFRTDPVILPAPLTAAPRVQHYEPDLSMDAINHALEAQVADESLSLQERMAPVPMLAGNDFALSRYAPAMEKYGLLLRYHAVSNNYAMAAFALNGMGEVYEKLGDLERANESYESALVLATHGEFPAIPIFLNVVLNLANLRVIQERWEDGEAYYDTAQQLAAAARNAPAKISSLERRGYCQQQQGRQEDAAKSWYEGTLIAAQLEDFDSCRKLLGLLQQHYTTVGESNKARELQEQLEALAAS